MVFSAFNKLRLNFKTGFDTVNVPLVYSQVSFFQFHLLQNNLKIEFKFILQNYELFKNDSNYELISYIFINCLSRIRLWPWYSTRTSSRHWWADKWCPTKTRHLERSTKIQTYIFHFSQHYRQVLIEEPSNYFEKRVFCVFNSSVFTSDGSKSQKFSLIRLGKTTMTSNWTGWLIAILRWNRYLKLLKYLSISKIFAKKNAN